MSDRAFDPELDLVLEREVPIAPELVWRAWTEPELLMQWFTPAPWRTIEAEVDPRPGGVFRTVMAGPDGEGGGGTGCVLEAAPSRRFAWTGALLPGFRPAVPSGEFAFTAFIDLEPTGTGTRYRATVKHADRAGRETHEQMGFEAGWGAALDQLVALMSS